MRYLKELAFTHNLRERDGVLSVEMADRKTGLRLPAGAALLGVHHVDEGSHYLFVNHDRCSLGYIDDYGRTFAITGEVDGGVGDQMAILGNIVILNADRESGNGLWYLVWKEWRYTLLEGELPFPTIHFATTKVSPDPYAPGAHRTVKSVIHNYRQLIGGSSSGGSGTTGLRNPTLHAEAVADATDHVYALLNSFMTEEVKKRGYFSQPFLLRYALRMYDGNYAAHSAPILMRYPTELPHIPFAVEPDGDNAIVTSDSSRLEYHRIDYRIDARSLVRLLKWEPLITAIDIFVSPEIPVYDTDGKIEGETRGEPNRWRIPANEHLKTRIERTSTFYRLASIPLDRALASEEFMPLAIDDKDLTNLEQRRVLPDDHHTRQAHKADSLYVYCNRLNIGGGKTRAALPYPPSTHSEWRGGNEPMAEVTGARVLIKVNGATIARELECAGEYLKTEDGRVMPPPYVYYPDSRAYRTEYTLADGRTIAVSLKPHETLAGAYATDAEGSEETPAQGEGEYIDSRNTIFTSANSNPFLFPAEGETGAGDGDIIALRAAVEGISQGQFGEYPLYAFTTRGIWALAMGSDGLYKSARPISQEVLSRSEALTQIADGAVAMITAQGAVMLLRGGTCTEISKQFTDYRRIYMGWNFPNIELLLHEGMDPTALTKWGEYAKWARLAFDYHNGRLIAWNEDYGYAWRLDMHSGRWGCIDCDWRATANDYPRLVVADRDGEIAICGEDDKDQHVMFIVYEGQQRDRHLPMNVDVLRSQPERGASVVVYGSNNWRNYIVATSGELGRIRRLTGSRFLNWAIVVAGTFTTRAELTLVEYDKEHHRKPGDVRGSFI